MTSPKPDSPADSQSTFQRDPIDQRIDRLTENINQLREGSEELQEEVRAVVESVRQLREESKELSIRFGYYQQSTQAIVNLAFSLIASATISVFITTILKR